MSIDKKSALEEAFPLPSWVKIRKRKFPKNPASPLQSTDRDNPNRAKFQLRLEDEELGLLVLIGEDASGHLIGEVFSTNVEHMKQAVVSVALVGTVPDQTIHRIIGFTTEEGQGKYRCRGSADFGNLDVAVNELGDQLGMMVFLNI